MRLLHAWKPDAATFDDENLVSAAGLVPVMALAEQTHLAEVIAERVRFDCERIASAAANPVGKTLSIIAGMLTGADSIADLQVIRSGGSKKLFGAVYAPSTLGMFLREFTHGHTRQLSAVLARHLLALVKRTKVLAGIDVQAFIDIDSLLRPVYGHAKQGASFGHTKIANRQVLRKGLSPLVTTISTITAAPVIAEVRLRAGKAGSGRGAASMVTEAINLAIAAGATAAHILVRGDSAYGYSDVINAVPRAGAKFSFVLTKNRAVNRAIGAIPANAWIPVRYPGAVQDPDTGQWISDAEVAEISYTLLAGTGKAVTARLIVRRVKDRNHLDELFPVWRYHPFFTNSTEKVTDADITHRRHAIIESMFADLIDRPWAHQPSSHFSANCAWTMMGAIAHNLLRAAGSCIDTAHAVARGATLRRRVVNVPARITRPQGRRILHLPTHHPHHNQWKQLWNNVFAAPGHPPAAA